MFAIFGEHRDSIQSRTVMMKLALQSAVFGRENEVPIASCAAVVAPEGGRRVIAEDSVEGNVSLVVIPEILRPCVRLFLPGRVPGPLAAQRVGFPSPSVRTGPHFRLNIIGLLLPSFTLQIAKNLEKDVPLHLSEDCQVCSKGA